MKTCPDCGQALPIKDFYRNKSRRPDGLSYRCKNCHKQNLRDNKVDVNAKRKIRRHKQGVSKWYNGFKKWINEAGEEYPKTKTKDNKYPENWDIIRKIIYKRDNWICQECGIKCGTKQDNRRIQCHHIDYNTRNNTADNLITLCASCHAKTNYSRNNWITYYQLRMSNQKEKILKWL